VSAPSFHPGQQKIREPAWAARLIPGVAAPIGRKKPQRETSAHPGGSIGNSAAFLFDTGTKAGASLQSQHGPGLGRKREGKSWMQSFFASVACILHSGALLAWRRAERKGSPRGTHSLGGVRNVLIVGASGLGHRLANHLQRHPELGRSVRGFLDDRKGLGKDVIGRTSDLAELARTGFVDEVILAGPHAREQTLRVLRAAQQLRLDVKIAPELFGCEPTRETERIGDIPLISLHEERVPVAGLIAKRALDVAVASGAVILMLPLLALLAILIRLDSPGPAHYAALRAGRKGRPFRCYKFRTMVRNADALKPGLRALNQREGPCFKIADDPRITRAGRVLRRYSLDELPQLWNVLRGDMSLVGPRPHPLDDFSAYGIEHLPRLDVVPGMTGLWQITARRNPSFQAGMDLDLEYIHRWSLGMDLKILLKTVAVVLRGSGE
jgi:exopolysaccharide biosynthesis polyprenyl glycosylphosphotransferase